MGPTLGVERLRSPAVISARCTRPLENPWEGRQQWEKTATAIVSLALPAPRFGASCGRANAGRLDRREYIVVLGERIVLRTPHTHPRNLNTIRAVRATAYTCDIREERTASFEKSTVPSSSVISNAPGLSQAHTCSSATPDIDRQHSKGPCFG